ncbi:MAG: ACT domain-containing protein, partial [Planctomycetota bacterium]|nr:ACT domain-containing protein [Planctomycetota bacterium]
MEIIVTALGPDHVGLADPIIHHITLLGANISEIQMYDHDEEAVFAMLLRLQLEVESLEPLRTHLTEIGES